VATPNELGENYDGKKKIQIQGMVDKVIQHFPCNNRLDVSNWINPTKGFDHG
jgi:hypothetical protein